MGRLFIVDKDGIFSAEVEATGVAREALSHPEAESVVGAAVLLAMASLVQGENWPRAVLDHLRALMIEMKDDVSTGVSLRH